MVLPQWSVTHDLVGLQIRFDIPASITTKDGKRKKLRYLAPPDMELRVDFPEGLPADRIWIAEGSKKADALRSRGEYALSVPGVWGWAGKVARKDLECLSWQNREAVVCFDSDAATNPHVRKAQNLLVRFLSDLGAQVKICLFEPSPDGQKVGADDWFAEGGTLSGLEKLLSAPAEEWKNELVLLETTGRIKITAYNILLILQNDRNFEKYSRCRKNELSALSEFPDGTLIAENDCQIASAFVEGEYKSNLVPPDLIRRCLEVIASKSSFHPVREWMDGLKWDRVPRIENFFQDFSDVPDSEYVRAVSRNFFVSAVARIFEPGCKVDTCLVLEGPQEIGKSTLISALFGEKWSTISRSEIGSKDFISGILGFWGVELSELASLRKSEIEHVKLVISAPFDDVRLPFRRDTVRYPRQCVFVATTNEKEYLADSTGNRRFLPVKIIDRIDLDSVKKLRDQLWAEAVFLYKSGATWWIYPESSKTEQDARYMHDSWGEKIHPWILFPGRTDFTVSDVLEDCLGIEIGKHGKSEQIRVGNILRKAGYEPVQVQIKGIPKRIYRKCPG